MPSRRSPTSPATTRSKPCATRSSNAWVPVDILVANAGGSTVGPGPLEDITEADWRGSVDANLTATFLTIKAFLPGMRERHHGTIITMSSAAARRPTPQSPLAYAAAKGGHRGTQQGTGRPSRTRWCAGQLPRPRDDPD